MDITEEDTLIQSNKKLSLFITHSNAEDGIEVRRWRSDGEIVKVIVRGLGSCPRLEGDGWMEGVEEFHLSVECKRPTNMESLTWQQLGTLCTLAMVASLSIIIYIFVKLHSLAFKKSVACDVSRGTLPGAVTDRDTLEKLVCKRKERKRMQSTRWNHVTPCDTPCEQTSKVSREGIFVVSSKNYVCQDRVDDTAADTETQTRRGNCFGCFPGFGSSRVDRGPGLTGDPQPDVLRPRYTKTFHPSSPTARQLSTSTNASTTTTPVSQRSFFTSLFIISLVCSTPLSSSCDEEEKPPRILVCLSDAISLANFDIYLNGHYVNFNDVPDISGTVRQTTEPLGPVLSTRDFDLNDVIDECGNELRKNLDDRDVPPYQECPEGYFSQHATENHSKLCVECKKCSESAYEISPCTPDQDRLCFPDPVFYEAQEVPQQDEEADDKGIVLETSSNVFKEDLLNTRNLETTYYVTDTTQASDFYWDRESGMRVNIGIHNVHLLPGYKDADHEGDSDNKFMSQNPDFVANQSFQAVRNSLCRYPVPDYYNLNLDVTPNRTTATERVVCSTEHGHCSQRHGQYQRLLNIPCPEATSHLVLQQQHPNSVVCVTESSMLSQIFKLTSGPDVPYGHYAKKCLLAYKKCNYCQEFHACKGAIDKFEKLCCRSECLSSADCKFYYSSTCTHLMSPCATGPTYRFTIEPVYRSLENEFRCHLVHETQPILYELFVFVQIPLMNFKTKMIVEKIPAKDFEFNVRGTFKVDFLTVEHSSELEMTGDLMLAGRKGNQRKMKFVIYPAEIKSPTIPKDYPVRYIKSNVWGTSMLPGKPFLHSTSTWNEESPSSCSKDVDEIVSLSSVPRIFHDASDMFSLNESSFFKVNVLIQNKGSHFSYHIKHANNPPYFRFIVPANTSILSYYAHEFPGLLHPKSIRAYLEKQEFYWSVSLNGKTTACPAFFETELHEGTLVLPVVARHDILVLCPPQFNLTFKIPLSHWNAIHRRTTTTFHLQVKDSEKTLEFFLTDVETDEPDASATNITLDKLSTEFDNAKFSHLLIWLVLTTGVLLTLSSFLCYVIAQEKRHFNGRYFIQRKENSIKMTACQTCRPPNYSIHVPCKTTPGFAEFLLLKTLYGVLFNFTAFFLALQFLILYDAKQLDANVKSEEIKLKNYVDKSIKIDERSVNGYRKTYRNMMACSRSATDTLKNVISRHSYIRELSKGDVDPLNLYCVYTNKVMNSRFCQFNRTLKSHTSLHSDKFSRFFEANVLNYYKFLLEKVFQNDWLLSASRSFNLSKRFSCNATTPSNRLDESSAHERSRAEFCFYQFMQLEDVDDVRPWLVNLKRKLHKTSPSVPINSFHRSWTNEFNAKKIGQRDHMLYLNSIKFVVVQFSDKKVGNVLPDTRLTEARAKHNYEKIVIKDFLEAPANTGRLARSLLYIMETCDKMFLVQSAWIFCAVTDILIFVYRINHSFASALIYGNSRGEQEFCSPFSSAHPAFRNRRSEDYCYWAFGQKLNISTPSHEKHKTSRAQDYISIAAANVDLGSVGSHSLLSPSGNSGSTPVSTRVVLLVVSSSLRNQEVSRIFLSIGLVVFLTCTFRIINDIAVDTRLFSIHRLVCDLPQQAPINSTHEYNSNLMLSYLKHFQDILEIDFANVQSFLDFFQSENEKLRHIFEATSVSGTSDPLWKKIPLVACSVTPYDESGDTASMECTEEDKSTRDLEFLLRKIELFTSTFVLLGVAGHFIFKTFLHRLTNSNNRHRDCPVENYFPGASSSHSSNKPKATVPPPPLPQVLGQGRNSTRTTPCCNVSGSTTTLKERIYTETKV